MPAIFFFAAEHLYGVLVTSNFLTVPKDFISKVSKAISNPSSAVEKILTDTQGFAAQLCEFARLLGCPDWMEIDNLVKPDITQDFAKYEYESPKSGLMDLLNNMYGGDVIEYIKSGV